MAGDGKICMALGDARAEVYPGIQSARLCVAARSGHLQAMKLFSLAVGEIFRIEKRFIIHAAALELNGAAVLVCAPSGYGKSTLSTIWAKHGAAGFMSDDRCVLQLRDDIVYCGGIAEPIALDIASRSLVEETCTKLPKARGGYDGKLEFDAEETFGIVVRDMLPVSDVLVLDETFARTTAAQQCNSSEIVDSIIRSSFYHGPLDVMRYHFDTLLGVLSHARSWRAPVHADPISLIKHLERIIEMADMPGKSKPAPCRPSLEGPTIAEEAYEKALTRACHFVSNERTHKLFQELNESETKDVLKAAKYHGLLAELGGVLKIQGGMTRLPHGLQNFVQSAITQAAQSRNFYLVYLENICRALNAASLGWCLVDGPSFPACSGNAPVRGIVSEVGLLIEGRDIDAGISILCGLGFNNCPTSSTAPVSNLCRVQRLIKNFPAPYTIAIYSSSTFDQPAGSRACDVDRIVERRRKINLNGSALYLPSVADSIVTGGIMALAGSRHRFLFRMLQLSKISARNHRSLVSEIYTISQQMGVSSLVVFSLRRAVYFFPDSAIGNLVPKLDRNRIGPFFMELLIPLSTTKRPWLKSSHSHRNLFGIAQKFGLLP